MTERTVEDHLREEYSLLLPGIKRVLLQLQTKIASLLLAPTLDLKHHERIQVEARVKDCDSAIYSLRRREEAGGFDEERAHEYSLTKLPDLAALRVLVFPKIRLEQVHNLLSENYADWTADPVMTGSPPKFRAWKYHGIGPADSRIRAEIQVAPMLTGLFWQIEHDAFYKPRDPVLRGAAKKLIVQEHTEAVYDAFETLEKVLEQEISKGGRAN